MKPRLLFVLDVQDMFNRCREVHGMRARIDFRALLKLAVADRDYDVRPVAVVWQGSHRSRPESIIALLGRLKFKVVLLSSSPVAGSRPPVSHTVPTSCDDHRLDYYGKYLPFAVPSTVRGIMRILADAFFSFTDTGHIDVVSVASNEVALLPVYKELDRANVRVEVLAFSEVLHQDFRCSQVVTKFITADCLLHNSDVREAIISSR